MTEKRKVMVIGAHPDDPDFSAGGSVFKWAEEGREVVYVVCTNGDKGSSDPEMTSARLAPIREREQLNAAKVLGVNEVVFLGYPDGSLEDTPVFRGEIVRLIRKYRPDLVVTHDPRRLMAHRDHRIAGRVTLDAIFPYARDHLSYPEHKAANLAPHKVLEIYLSGSEEPNLFVDINDVFETKMRAIACHVSQVGDHSGDWDTWVARRKEQTIAMLRQPDRPLSEAFFRIEVRR